MKKFEINLICNLSTRSDFYLLGLLKSNFFIKKVIILDNKKKISQKKKLNVEYKNFKILRKKNFKFIEYLKQKKINWKTAFLGLFTQLILAILIIRVEFVQNIFEFFGKIFVKTLDFTMEGSRFLLGDMVNVESFGYVFLFQVLPTIIFFSALTSVLFYLGIIQKIVKLLAWSLSKLLNISSTIYVNCRAR